MLESIIQIIGVALFIYFAPHFLGRRWREGTIDAERGRMEHAIHEVISDKIESGDIKIGEPDDGIPVKVRVSKEKKQ